MLVLSRKSGESLHIGDGIIVTVLNAQKGRVRIGVQAPRSMSVLRAELWRRALSEVPVGGSSPGTEQS